MVLRAENPSSGGCVGGRAGQETGRVFFNIAGIVLRSGLVRGKVYGIRGLCCRVEASGRCGASGVESFFRRKCSKLKKNNYFCKFIYFGTIKLIIYKYC